MIWEKCLWALAVVLTIGMGLSGCTSIPLNSRTSTVHDVRIDEALSDGNLLVQPDDEVRFVNLRKQVVQVELPNLKSEDLSCAREFSNWAGSVREIAVLQPNQSASLCFKKPAVVSYTVRMDTALAGSTKILNGVINVEAPLSTKPK